MSSKSRVSYDKDLRAAAKAAGEGLITISVTHPNGERTEYQVRGSAKECRFARWAGVLLGEPEAQPCLETFVRDVLQANE
jgi:hypothetical protein